MRRTAAFAWVILTWAAMAAPCPGQEAEAQPGRLLLIANKADDTLWFVDLASNRLVGRATTGHRPHEVIASPDGRRAFVANYGAGDSVSVIDVPSRKELSRINLGRFRDPHGLAIGPDGKTLFVTCEANRAVVAIDPASGRVVRSFATNQDVTHMLALAPDARTLFAANIRSGSVTAIDLMTGTASSLATGAGCEGLDVSPDGREVWATNKGADTISVLSAAGRRVEATLPCRGRPIRVKFTPDGHRALVSCARSNEVAVFDVAARAETHRIRTDRAPIGLVIEPDGRRAFVANTEADRVSVLDLASLTITGTIATGREPDGLAIVWARVD